MPPSAWSHDQPRQAKKLVKHLRQAATHLERIEQLLDPIELPDEVFTLTDPQTVGEVVVHKLLHRDKVQFTDVHRFYGSGVYALYYEGDLPVYEAISRTECPIYVGSAGPDLPTADTPRDQGVRLFGRLSEHFKKSLSKSTDLTPDQFRCRYLVVQSGLEKAAEDFLIRLFHPVWNKESKICSGFGKHGDRARSELSPWDILHGDRGWTEHQTSLRGKTPESVATDIQNHFKKLLERNPNRWRKYFNKAWIKSNTVI